MARKAHKPEPTSRRQVEAMAAYGVPEADIATVIGIDPKTLRKHYRTELNTGPSRRTAGSPKACSGKPWVMAPNP